MLVKEDLERFIIFFQKIPADITILEKWLRKIKSEKLIKDYKVVGDSIKTNSFVFDMTYRDCPYRVTLPYNYDNKITGIQIINLDDLNDVSDIYIKKWYM